ncbi:MAG: SLC13 family permease [Pseudomonadota bacterium]|nr:SLC13 family permease [Pseudomonadota bacterium]MDP1902679.1 SLC13 family permease [Pseudomonadota bacterium]MDP2353357.1 SLC13 family permease [Pseudomonadota bacterium]
MSWEAWLTLAVVALCIGLLAGNRYPPDTVMLGGLTLLLLTGVLTPAEALAGLANEGMVTVAVLYVVVSGFQETGGTAWVSQSLLGRPRSIEHAQMRLMAPVAFLSAFLNNTPVVAMFIPAVKDWARRHGMAVSHLMLPLSYAAIAGGTCTLIGTSTNLVVNGLLVGQTGERGLSFFEIAWVGVPTLLLTILFTALLGRRLLPERHSILSRLEDTREYTVEMLVEPHSPLDGKRIEDAGLRQLPGMYLVEINRDGQLMPAVSPQQQLRGGDRLLFAGVVDSVLDLRRIRGLKPADDQVFKLQAPHHQRCLVEAVVSDSFPLLGKSIREGRFRSHYQAAIIAVARNGERIERKIGDIVPRPGDTLLLETHPGFAEHYRNARDFLLVSRLDNSTPPRHERAWIAVVIMAGMVLLAALSWLSMLQAAMLAAGLMLFASCTTASAARRAVDWQVLLVIAAAFGIGLALEKTGAANVVAGGLVGLAGDNPWATLALVFLATSLFTNLITNNAAAALMFPIALAAASRLDVSVLPFAIVIMKAASASFATPVGYQTNLMVMGPGGYAFADYLRMGIPLTVLSGILTVLIAPLVWPF